MRQISDSKNIKMGVVLSYIGMFVSIFGALFVTNRVLNYIGDYNYGLYSFVNSITSWLTIVSSALASSFLKFTTVESKENNGDTSRTNSLYFKLLLYLGVGILVIGLSTIGILYGCKISLGKYDWEDSKLMYALFALSIFNISLTMPTCVYSLYIHFKNKFVFGKVLSIATTIINFVGHLLIAYFTHNIIFIAIFTIVMTLSTFGMNFWFSKKSLNIKFAKASIKENKVLIGSIIAFSSILLFNTIVDQVNTNVDKTLLGIFSIPEDVAIYQVGQQFGTYMMTMSVAVSGVFAPTLHHLVVNKNQNEINRLYLKISRAQTIILCAVAFGFLTCGYDFVLWWLGPNRINVFYVGAILLLVNLCPLTLNSSIEIQRAENKHKFRAFVYFGAAILNVLLSIAFLFLLPQEKAIFACLIGTVITKIGSHWIAMNIYNKKEIKLPVGKYMFTLLSHIILGFFGFIIVWRLRELLLKEIDSDLLKFICEGCIFVVIYLAGLVFIDHEVISELKEKIRKKFKVKKGVAE